MSTWKPLGGAGAGGDDQPRRVGDALGRFTRSLGGPDAELLGIVFAKWPETVGAGIADHASPAALRDETLVVEVVDPAWATQLRFLEKEILDRLGAAAGRPVAERIEIRVRAPGRARTGRRPARD